MRKLTKYQIKRIKLFLSICFDLFWIEGILWLAVNGAIDFYFTCFR